MQVKLTFNLLDRPNDTGNLVLAHLDMRESALQCALDAFRGSGAFPIRILDFSQGNGQWLQANRRSLECRAGLP